MAFFLELFLTIFFIFFQLQSVVFVQLYKPLLLVIALSSVRPMMIVQGLVNVALMVAAMYAQTQVRRLDQIWFQQFQTPPLKSLNSVNCHSLRCPENPIMSMLLPSPQKQNEINIIAISNAYLYWKCKVILQNIYCCILMIQTSLRFGRKKLIFYQCYFNRFTHFCWKTSTFSKP